MRKSIIIRIVLGLMLIVSLTFAGYRLLDMLAGFFVDALSGRELADDGYENEYVTPEPMPTMPGYIGEDSFYDDADGVIFDGE